ncbi:MAG: hypothetical protein FWB80_01470 [Defluviitaleaceae bacterium]|nr:hypothetical protein [Defluviitaleaceae bacterium]
MYIAWEEAKQKYIGQWVVLKNPMYADQFHMKLVGGELVGVADDAVAVENLMPDLDDGNFYTARHTREDEAVGLLKSGF